MKNNFSYDEFWDNIHINSEFEPTINPFHNGLVINHKKVGTRYFDSLLSLPDESTKNKIQMDLYISNNSHHQDGKSFDTEEFKVQYKFYSKYCYNEFDKENSSLKPVVYKNYSNTQQFINYCGVNDYTELFFHNKKDIIFVVRNPIHRFISGTIQILFGLLNEVFNDENLRREIKFFTNLDDTDLKKIIRYANDTNVNEKSLSNLEKNELEILCLFLLEKKWDLLYQDIHTQNYLHYFIEWIYNIEDETKIKIIDLKDCRSKKSLEFFSNLLGNDLLNARNQESFHYETYWETLGKQTGTNKIIYDFVIKNIYNKTPEFFNNSTLSYYIRDEFQVYNTLINSKFFVDLKD